MYIFVFLWTPVLLQNSPRLPLGLVFSTFMVCIMLGSQVSAWLHNRGLSHLLVLRRSLLVMAVSLTVTSFASPSTSITFFSFLMFEVAIGGQQLSTIRYIIQYQKSKSESTVNFTRQRALRDI